MIENQKTQYLSHYLELIKPHIPEELISEESYTNIRRIALHIPGALAFSTFGFECRLGTPTANADFLFSLQSDNSGPEILAGKLPDNDFPPEFFNYPVWSRIRDFGRLWADPPSPLYESLDDVWLEFDIHTFPEALLPSIFFSPLHKFERDGPGLNQFKTEELLALIESVYACTKGRSPGAAMSRKWQSCIEMLPRLKALFQVGIMLGRPSANGIRTCVSVPSGKAVTAYLNAVDWPGDVAKLQPMLKKLSPWFDSLALHLDVSDELSPKISIECKFLMRRGPDREPLWHDFLAFLMESGLCLPKKRDALLAFPGYCPTDVDVCPLPLKRLADRLEMVYRSFFVRTIYHVKLVYNEKSEWEAKGYLGVNHIWKGIRGDYEKGRGRWGLIG